MISGTFYTQGEVADILKRNRHTIGRWIDRGKLPAIRLGNLLLIRKEDVERICRCTALRSASAGEPDVGEGGP